MKEILLLTLDDTLHRRLSIAMGSSCDIVRSSPFGAPPLPSRAVVSLVLFDARRRQPSSTAAELSRLNSAVGAGVRIVTIIDLADVELAAIVRASLPAAFDPILPTNDSMEPLIQLHLDDLVRAAAPEEALEVLLEQLPSATHESLRVVLSSGFRISSVKELAAQFHRERTAIGKALCAKTAWTPSEIVGISKASCATILLRETSLKPTEVGNAIRQGTKRSLDHLLMKFFLMRASEIRSADRQEATRSWLELHLADLIERRGSGLGDSL